MKSTQLMNIVLLILLTACLVAPFTFLKPNHLVKSIDDNKAKKSIVKPVEKPLHNVKLPKFSTISDIPTKKKKFFDFIKPAVIKKNNELRATRVKLKAWLEHVSLGQTLSADELESVKRLVKKYRVNEESELLTQLNILLMRVDVIPTALVLVQAANESAWGTSRFSRIGLNFFGIWCYKQGCGMVPGSRNSGANHEVAAFGSISEAVSRYFNNINTHNAYRVFRTIRHELRSQNQALHPEILATGLLPYSERGADYVIELTNMLRHNQQYLQENKIAHDAVLGE